MTPTTTELGGIAEIADEFDVPRTTASMWYVRRATSGFPGAVAVLGMGPVFDMAAVRRWYAEKYPGKKEST
jgi:hypothetical protein